MSYLTWVGDKGKLSKAGVVVDLKSKPTFTFEYDSLYYEPDTEHFKGVINGEDFILTIAELTEVLDFLTNFALPNEGHYINSDGTYAGFGRIDGLTEVPEAPPTAGNYIWESNAWVYLLGVDVSGHYIGNRPLEDYSERVPTVPPGEHFKWDFILKEWTDTRNPEVVKAEALLDIDRKAGEVRARYITDTPGQAEVYMMKLKEAEEYAIAAAQPQPVDMTDFPFIEGESIATGVPADDVATSILTVAAAWKAKAVSIESKRMAAKKAVTEAVDTPTAHSRANQALADLDVE